MLGFNGGRLGTRNATTAGVLGASGLWLPSEQCTAKTAGAWPWGPNEVPNIGDAFGGGFFAGYISHTANGVATHALIVAPRATGASGFSYPLTTTYAAKTAASTTPGTASVFDGAANTAAMVANNIAIHPAANFCVGRTIGGYSDWYLPSVLELAIAYTNFKPGLALNVTSTGINAYSVPPRTVNYTTTVPAQSSVLAFRDGGTEVFYSEAHWSSTEAGGNGEIISYNNGARASLSKTTLLAVRAFRRVAL